MFTVAVGTKAFKFTNNLVIVSGLDWGLLKDLFSKKAVFCSSFSYNWLLLYWSLAGVAQDVEERKHCILSQLNFSV